MKPAIIRLIDVDREPLRITVLEQPVRDGGYHSFEITRANLSTLLEDLAAAAGRRLREG